MPQRIPVIIDTDANNEIDDQHAIAYSLFSDEVLEVVGVTVNNTPLGKGIQGHYDEAKRVLQLCNAEQRVPLFKGVVGNFNDILPSINENDFDGHEAVEFIIEQAMEDRSQKLVLLPIGKLTNIALALAKTPAIKDKIKVVWLGSNYPDSGEYNLVADPDSVNYVLESGVDFEMVMVRYADDTGSAAVQVTREQIQEKMPNLGPQVSPVEGRQGGSFSCWGDYSVNLFENFPRTTWSLFDVVAAAVVKKPEFGRFSRSEVPKLNGDAWDHDSGERYSAGIWEHFDKEALVSDFFETMKNAKSR